MVADGNHCLIDCEPLHYKLAEAMSELSSIGLAWGFQKAQNKLVPCGYGVVSVKGRILQAKEVIDFFV